MTTPSYTPTSTQDGRVFIAALHGVFDTFDLATTFETEAELTDDPLEQGQPLTDHHVRKPRKVTITAGISDVIPGWQARIPAAVARVQAMFDTHETTAITTHTGNYLNMAVVRIRHQTDEQIGLGLVMTIRFQEVLYATPPKGPQTGPVTQQQAARNRGNEQLRLAQEAHDTLIRAAEASAQGRRLRQGVLPVIAMPMAVAEPEDVGLSSNLIGAPGFNDPTTDQVGVARQIATTRARLQSARDDGLDAGLALSALGMARDETVRLPPFAGR